MEDEHAHGRRGPPNVAPELETIIGLIVQDVLTGYSYFLAFFWLEFFDENPTAAPSAIATLFIVFLLYSASTPLVKGTKAAATDLHPMIRLTWSTLGQLLTFLLIQYALTLVTRWTGTHVIFLEALVLFVLVGGFSAYFARLDGTAALILLQHAVFAIAIFFSGFFLKIILASRLRWTIWVIIVVLAWLWLTVVSRAETDLDSGTRVPGIVTELLTNPESEHLIVLTTRTITFLAVRLSIEAYAVFVFDFRVAGHTTTFAAALAGHGLLFFFIIYLLEAYHPPNELIFSRTIGAIALFFSAFLLRRLEDNPRRQDFIVASVAVLFVSWILLAIFLSILAAALTRARWLDAHHHREFSHLGARVVIRAAGLGLRVLAYLSIQLLLLLLSQLITGHLNSLEIALVHVLTLVIGLNFTWSYVEQAQAAAVAARRSASDHNTHHVSKATAAAEEAVAAVADDAFWI